MREKKRYIVFEVMEKKPLDFKEVKKAINETMLQFLGELGAAKAGIIILDEWKDNKGIMKTNNKYVNEAKTALILTKEIENEKVAIRVLGVSGIIKKAKNKFL